MTQLGCYCIFYRCVGQILKWEFSSAGRAPALQAGGHRFEPCNSHHYMFTRCTISWCGSTVEQLICNQQVGGSIPSTSSKIGRNRTRKGSSVESKSGGLTNSEMFEVVAERRRERQRKALCNSLHQLQNREESNPKGLER